MIKKISGLFWTGARRFLRIGIPLTLIGITGMLINIYDPAILDFTTKAIREHSTSYLLFRWGVICSFILCWPYLVTKFGHRWEAAPELILHWRNETWRIAFWLILIEIIVCENLIGKSIHLFGGL
jgi:hypothetical protein